MAKIRGAAGGGVIIATGPGGVLTANPSFRIPFRLRLAWGAARLGMELLATRGRELSRIPVDSVAAGVAGVRAVDQPPASSLALAAGEATAKPSARAAKARLER
jgi:hypothetical protein